MSFPTHDYNKAVAALRTIVTDRDAKGRNKSNDFYSVFLHGAQDIVFECHQRMERMKGADQLQDHAELREQFLDMANYCLFGIMLLDRAQATTPDLSEHL